MEIENSPQETKTKSKRINQQSVLSKGLLMNNKIILSNFPDQTQ